MEMMFMALGLIDFVAGGILFLDISPLTKLIAIALLTKGFVTVFKSIQH
jgi:energy-converting hydrogenase Eha subunit C